MAWQGDQGPGDIGGSEQRPAERMRDMRMLERAAKQRWPIPDAWREPLLARMARIALEKSSTPREATAAFKAILAADQINLNAELGNVEERLLALEEITKRATHLDDQS